MACHGHIAKVPQLTLTILFSATRVLEVNIVWLDAAVKNREPIRVDRHPLSHVIRGEVGIKVESFAVVEICHSPSQRSKDVPTERLWKIVRRIVSRILLKHGSQIGGVTKVPDQKLSAALFVSFLGLGKGLMLEGTDDRN
jgi:hypothetical protein